MTTGMTRDDIHALLPFLANNTLTGDERTAVQSAVDSDAQLQNELATLKAIRTTMQAEKGFSPGEMGLARLMRDVDAAPVANAPKRPWMWQAAAAVLLAVVLGQGLLMRQTGAPDGYRLAGGDAGGDTAAFTVSFSPDVTEANLRALLMQAGVEIIGGPSALGLYQLAPLEGVLEQQASDILAASDFIDSIELPEK